jgi:hypothetical protein
MNENMKVYELDNYGISKLEGIGFKEQTEEISLFNNEIGNPGEISTFLAELPNLRGLWLNGNPVVHNCVNFNQIGEIMPVLEILNSKFTTKAGEWALLYYARDQKVSSLSEIRSLDLSGKGVLHMANISYFEQMSSLKSLNIEDHPEFFLTKEQQEEEEK